jgi:hypothetical protein
MEFVMECQGVLRAIVKKIQGKSPLKYPIVQNMACLNPKEMAEHPERSRAKFRKLLQILLDTHHLAGGLARGGSAHIWIPVSNS